VFAREHEHAPAQVDEALRHDCEIVPSLVQAPGECADARVSTVGLGEVREPPAPHDVGGLDTKDAVDVAAVHRVVDGAERAHVCLHAV